MLAFVLNSNNQPLMPCSSRKARLLLKQNKANIINKRKDSFTIQLNYNTTNFTQPLTIGVDTGSKNIGIAIKNGNNILQTYLIYLRTDIKSLLETRKTLRRARRNKFRYRPVRFLNRIKPIGWLPPSIQSRVNNLIHRIKLIQAKLPFSNLILEVGNFDVQKMVNPNIQGKEYQQGLTYGFNELREFILARDHYSCQNKSCTKTDKHLHVHHKFFKSQGGTDRADNLITLCKKCHMDLHQGILDVKFKRVQEYKEPPFMNSLKLRLQQTFPNAVFSFGYITKAKRQLMKLEKTHVNDAIAISFLDDIRNDYKDYHNDFIIMQFRSKKRSLHEQTARKGRSKPNVNQIRNNKNVRAVGMFKLGMQVIYDNKLAFISGFTGKSAYLKDVNNEYLHESGKNYKQISLTKLRKVCYNNNWISFDCNSSLNLAKGLKLETSCK